MKLAPGILRTVMCCVRAASARQSRLKRACVADDDRGVRNFSHRPQLEEISHAIRVVHSSRRRAVQPVLIKLGLFVLAGAIVNVAVAWGCALGIDVYAGSRQLGSVP